MNNRMIGVDLLRLLSMFMIVLIHVNNFGGLLQNKFFSVDFLPIYLFESLGIVAVNCFVLISGFFLIKQDFKLKKLIALIFETSFYSSLLLIVALIIKTPVNIKLFIENVFAPFSGVYWFVTCYIMLYIFSTFINKFIDSLTIKQKHTFAIITIFIFCLWGVIPKVTHISILSGYSFLWLVILYYWWAYIRLVFVEGENKQLFEKISKFSLYGYIIFSLITVFIMCALNFIKIEAIYALKYNSLFIFLASVCLFIFMYKLEIKNNFINKLICFFAPASFGVYLISCSYVFIKYQKIYLNKDFFLQSFNMPLMVLICAIGIFFVCLLISKFFHQKIFNFSDKYIFSIIEKIFIYIENKIFARS